LVTDPTFKVGIESQRGHVHGVLNCGSGKCIVEQIQNEDKVDPGEWFYTSGEDRIFPKGFPVGTVVSSQPGQGMRDIRLNLSGAPGGAEEVLVVLQGVHRQIPAAPPVEHAAAKMLPAPPPENPTEATGVAAKPQTEADKIVEKYQALGKAQNHEFGAYGSNVPNFNAKAEVPQIAKPVANLVPEPKPAVPPKPSILGARPGAKIPEAVAPASKPVTKSDSEPALLGAPRRKPAPDDE
jgi:rod shape-determining protein MreC